MALTVPHQHVRKHKFLIPISSLFAPGGIKTRAALPRAEIFPNEIRASQKWMCLGQPQSK